MTKVHKVMKHYCDLYLGSMSNVIVIVVITGPGNEMELSRLGYRQVNLMG